MKALEICWIFNKAVIKKVEVYIDGLIATKIRKQPLTQTKPSKGWSCLGEQSFHRFLIKRINIIISQLIGTVVYLMTTDRNSRPLQILLNSHFFEI
jgi:hypothetical protein